jgi:hypothetical protein
MTAFARIPPLFQAPCGYPGSPRNQTWFREKPGARVAKKSLDPGFRRGDGPFRMGFRVPRGALNRNGFIKNAVKGTSVALLNS